MENSEYLSSKEAKTFLKISDCELSHYRVQSKLKFIKKGNAFLYLKSSIDDLLLLIKKGNKQ
jgi:hypothetical protein